MHPVASPALIKTPSLHSCVYTEDSFQTLFTLLSVWTRFSAPLATKKRKKHLQASLKLCPCPAKKSLVQRFLLDPDGGAVEGRAVPQVPAQNVLAELGRVDAPTAGRPDAEALLEETFEDLQTDISVHGDEADTRTWWNT